MKMLKTILLIAATLFANAAFAQNEMKARVEFEEAETAYLSGDYELSISKLNKAEKLLKSTNPKIRYLKIAAQFNLIENKMINDYAIIANTRILSDKYLNDYGNSSDLEDKYRDIYKINKALKNYPKTNQEFEIWMNQQQEAKQKIVEDQLLVKSMIEYINSKYGIYNWRPNLTENEFLSNNPEIKSHKWTRSDYQDMQVVMKNVGTPLSVAGYYPVGPANYVIDKSGIIVSFSSNLKTVKNKIEEMKKQFEEMKSEDAKYGKYITSKDTSYTIAVPRSADNPDDIAYYISITLIQVDKWSFMSIVFSVDTTKK